MTACLSEIAAILEQEINVAEELEKNLAGQKQALLDWNMDSLLAALDARATWLGRLETLERERAECLARCGYEQSGTTLRHLLSALPPDVPQRDRLAALRGDSEKIFRRVQADERVLHELMEELLAHIHGALKSLLPSNAATYGETGITEPARPQTVLLHGRA
jgi:flagellar biosynthesis/type III secretory pathway chaperone